MTFYTQIIQTKPLNWYKYKLIIWGRRKILLTKFGATEDLLDSYLLKNYKINLKTACLWILTKTTFMTDYANSIVGKIKDPTADKLARLITYGTGNITGSKILKKALQF